MESIPGLASPTVDLDLLRSFIAIAETGNMTNAAKVVFRTPAAISMQVKKLEAQLDKKLLERSSRAIVLTKDGETLLSYGRQLLSLNQTLMDAFIKPNLQGTVRLGLPEQFGATVLPAILAQFKRDFPHVDVDVLLGRSVDIKDKFDAASIDLGLISSNELSLQSPQVKFLRSEPMYWVSQKGSEIPAQRPLLLSLAEPGCSWRKLALEALDNARIPYRIAYTSDNFMGQLAAVDANLAIAAVPESLLKKRLVDISPINSLPPMGSVQSYLLLSGSASPAAQTLGRYLEGQLTENSKI
ncbi:LysR family transcriptional regulator [Alteromonas lipolytica]|uniref:HTH lysR-type domain-containing protein n=1 Tax=Alteromonas lipolytica TaxID=1856405 RepID=A0A1E8FA48_9ALTE|nr:LysR family transcriptional regulator [Alteromonas lipolytica]OFI32403.1 hypothetical protein BFC17_06720 [Alteromonas lipolytica]GGF79967.1 LysR family transcriptional regulator [Alteromonas lipolytica]